MATIQDQIKKALATAKTSSGVVSKLQKETSQFGAVAQKQREALFQRQKAEQEGLFGKFEGIRGGQERLSDAFGRIRGEEGILELEESVAGFREQESKTRELLDRLKEDVESRTEGTFLTEAQVRRQEAVERDPLVTQLGRIGAGLAPVAQILSDKIASVGTQLGLLQSDQDRAVEGVTLRINSISDRFAREITGFETGKQQQLDILMDKLQNQRELADREWQLAQQLAAEEIEFQRQKQLIAQQQAENISINDILGVLQGGGAATTGAASLAQSVGTAPSQSQATALLDALKAEGFKDFTSASRQLKKLGVSKQVGGSIFNALVDAFPGDKAANIVSGRGRAQDIFKRFF